MPEIIYFHFPFGNQSVIVCMQEPTVPSNRNIQPCSQSPLATPSAHQVAGCNLWYYSNHEQILTTELAYYGNINIRGVVNDTTVHAQMYV